MLHRIKPRKLMPPFCLKRATLTGYVAGALLSAAGPAAGESARFDNVQDMVAALRTARPGATLFLAPGNYPGGLALDGIGGEEGRPVTLASEDPERPAVLQGGHTGLQLSRVKHLELRDLVFQGAQGNGLNIDDGGQRDQPSHHVTLRGLVVRDIGPQGNRDGIKLSGLKDFLVEDCRVERWGDAGSAIDMVGCHRGRIVGSQFERARGMASNGVQAKGGSSGITIEGCVFHDAGGRAINAGGSTGLDYFRPPDATQEAKDITVQDCLFLGASAAVAFVGVDGALFQHNTIYHPRPWVVRILQENQGARFVACRGGRFLNNIIVFDSGELRSTVNIGPKTEPETFRFEGNAWYGGDRPEQTERLVRLPVQESSGIYGVDPLFRNPARGDFSLSEESALQGKGARGLGKTALKP